MEGGEGIKNHIKFADVLMDGPQHLWIEGSYLNKRKLVMYMKQNWVRHGCTLHKKGQNFKIPK